MHTFVQEYDDTRKPSRKPKENSALLDRETVIRSPHDATVTFPEGKKHVEVHDPRVSVAMVEGGVKLTLFFEHENAFAGEADPVEVRLEPHEGSDPFDPWRFMPKLPLYVSYAKASLAHRENDIRRALSALRTIGVSRRGLGDQFYRTVAEAYESLVASGERYPVKALAEMQPVDISTASRWISEARRRGYVPPSEPGKVKA